MPGKKQWVWGCGDFGRAWDRNLTDADGPYAELMCGVFADNQPDFSWLQPFEEKEARQYFLPYKAIGYVRNATVDASVSLELATGQARLGAYATARRESAKVRLSLGRKVLWEVTHDLAPDRPLAVEVKLPLLVRPEELELSVSSREGEELVFYRPEPKQDEPIPQPAKAIARPERLKSNEDLYLAGLHLEQYRHATREPENYYREALRRDPGDIRNNNALGLLLMRRGQFSKAEPFFRAAIQRQTKHNPNPLDGEPYYNLGVCLRYLGRADEARDAFYKATWNAAWQDAAFFHLAQIDTARGQFETALEFVECALARNRNNQEAAHLKMILLRKAGKRDKASETAKAALARDPLDFGALTELELLSPRGASLVENKNAPVQAQRGPNLHESLETAAEYAHAGCYEDAIRLLERAAKRSQEGGSRAPGHLGEAGMPNARPMLFYFLGYYASQKGDRTSAASYFKLAASQRPDCCFPNSLDAILALRAALDFNPQDAHASLYLGNLWYDQRQVSEAVARWEAARRANPLIPTVHRNLTLVYFNKEHNPAKALRSMRKAFYLDPADARVLFELDLLKKRAGVSPQKRFRFLCTHRETVHQREDLLLEFVTLLNVLGRQQEALDTLLSRKFHPWEGGEGKVTGQYVTSLVELAKRCVALNRTEA
ncbi:MAG: tetratricopeptide repeat protein, partial [Limisphaerales bacterium]